MSELILFDVTRLVARLRIQTPTGIDRVEYAYARYLKNRYPEHLRFVMHWRGYLRELPVRLVSKYLDVLAHQWGLSETSDVRQSAGKISAFLGDSGLTAGIEGEFVREHRRNMRRLWRLRLRVTLSSKPLRLSPFTGGERRFYINVSHEGLDAAESIAAWTRKDGIRPIFLLHDLIPITHPEYVRRGHAERHAKRVRTMIAHGSSILTNSAFTAYELGQFAAREGHDLPPVDVALLSSGIDAARETEVLTSKPYFVTVGTIEPRKNHIFLLQLWRQMAERMGPKTPKLLLIGRRGWENENAIDLIERCAAIREHVLECESVPDILLQRLIKNASAMVFPSFVEGYGMPLVEALALGVPVIASDIDVFREIGQDVPEFLDPLDGPSWTRVICEYAEPGSPRRKAQLDRLRRFTGPNWDDHFHVLERALDRIRQRAAAGQAQPSGMLVPSLAE